MKNRIRYAALLLLAASALCGSTTYAQWDSSAVPLKPDPIVVIPNGDGIPPAISASPWDSPDEFNADFGVQMQVEFWKETTPGRLVLFASTWFNDSSFYASSEYDDDLEEQVYRSYLRGSGPGGLRIFPVGRYVARWRGWNPNGPGAWDLPNPAVGTGFVVTHPATLTTAFVQSPDEDGPNYMVEAEWENNFIANLHEAQIRRNGKVVRQGKMLGGLDEYGLWNLMDEDAYRGWAQDDPDQPSLELPDGEYTARVRSYSPVLRKWSPWVETGTFLLQRGMPSLPTLDLSQEDYDGFFDRSHRPYFNANYDERSVVPLWTQYEITQQVGKSKRLVRRQWVRSYPAYGYGNGGHGGLGGGSAYGDGWRSDLPAGDYVWRAQSWNPGKGNSVLTPWTTSTLHQATRPDVPPADAIEIYTSQHGYRYQSLEFAAVPNAYAYEIQMYRAGKRFAMHRLDTGRNLDLWGDQESVEAWSYLRRRVPDGDYTFSVRAVNMGNQAKPYDLRYSAWSQVSATPQEVRTQKVTPTNLDAHVWDYHVYLHADFVYWGDREFEVESLDVKRFRFKTDRSSISLPPGNYRFRARQGNAWTGLGGWSGWEEFEVGGDDGGLGEP